MDIVVFHSAWTALLMAVFIGIVVWAWSGRRKRSFDAAARLPLEDEDGPEASTPDTENKHG